MKNFNCYLLFALLGAFTLYAQDTPAPAATPDETVTQPSLERIFIEVNGMESHPDIKKEFTQKLGDSLQLITQTLVLSSATLKEYGDSVRSDRMKPSHFKKQAFDHFNVKYFVDVKIDPTVYSEGRWMWFPVAGEQTWTQSLSIKIRSKNDSLVMAQNFADTTVVTDWYCGMWECQMRPLAAAEQHANSKQSLQRLLEKAILKFRGEEPKEE